MSEPETIKCDFCLKLVDMKITITKDKASVFICFTCARKMKSGTYIKPRTQ